LLPITVDQAFPALYYAEFLGVKLMGRIREGIDEGMIVTYIYSDEIISQNAFAMRIRFGSNSKYNINDSY
jgi:hypothetical protein